MDKTGQPLLWEDMRNICCWITFDYYAKKANGKAWSKFLWEDMRNIWSLNYNLINKLKSYIERPGQHLLWENMRNIWFKLQSWKFNGKDLVHWHMAFGKNVDTLFAFSESSWVKWVKWQVVFWKCVWLYLALEYLWILIFFLFSF